MDLQIFLDDPLQSDFVSLCDKHSVFQEHPELLVAFGLFMIGGIVGVKCDFAKQMVVDFNEGVYDG